MSGVRNIPVGRLALWQWHGGQPGRADEDDRSSLWLAWRPGPWQLALAGSSLAELQACRGALPFAARPTQLAG
jgi:hypothetical protein